MGSQALIGWQTNASAAFDEIEHAHRAVGGSGPGRRFLTQQLNYAYATILAARFQGFARALHTQAADKIAAESHRADYRVLVFESLTSARALDRRNATPDAIATDFERFGIDVWEVVTAARKGNDDRRRKLEALITWRNAIAHDEVDAKRTSGALRPQTLSLATCRGWRSALSILAVSLDSVVADRCEALGAPRPW